MNQNGRKLMKSNQIPIIPVDEKGWQNQGYGIVVRESYCKTDKAKDSETTTKQLLLFYQEDEQNHWKDEIQHSYKF